MGEPAYDGVVEHSREIIRHGSKSFSAAARLFDEGTRSSAYMLYAWCRSCDDEIDGQTLGHYPSAVDANREANVRLAELYRKTADALSGNPTDDPVFAALQRVVVRHQIPERYPFELLEGFAMDVEGQTYETLDDTLRYCYHVAGVVGVMMAYVMGVREPETVHRAADLGIAFQLTNICRDVTEDAAVGRRYLPAEWLRAAGVPPARFLEAEHRDGLLAVVRRLLAEADAYYGSAKSGIPALPLRCAWAIATARGVYRNIGRVVLGDGKAAWERRAVVSRRRKIYLALRGFAHALVAVSVKRRLEPEPRHGLWTRPSQKHTPILSGLART